MHLSHLKPQLAYLLIACIALTAVHAQILSSMAQIIARDTILTLPPTDRVLLIALAFIASSLLALICLGKTRYSQHTVKLSKQRSSLGSITLTWLGAALLDLAVTAGMLWTALCVAPQLFYTLYQVVIPGLPLQWVGQIVTISQWVELLNLERSDSLSALSTGFLLLVVMLATLLSWLHLLRRVLHADPQ